MKTMKNERGYALLAVLLLIVLVLGVTATFMAGSLNNAKQEKTIDTSNQSVAAAEMGVLYYSIDFERALDLINKEVTAATTAELNLLVNCLKSTDTSLCNTATNRKTWEAGIDDRMKKLFVQKVIMKINELSKIKGIKTESFSSTQVNFVPQPPAITNVAYTTSELEGVKPELVLRIINAGKLEVKMEVVGTASSNPKKLSSVFSIAVPPTFLNQSEVINVDQTILLSTEAALYGGVFKPTTPTQLCSALMKDLADKKEVASYDCKITGDEKLSTYITKINQLQITPKLSPKDFWFYPADFTNNICDKGNSCNNEDFSGANIVVQSTDTGFTNNLNKFKNANIVINGLMSIKNMNKLGVAGATTTIVVKELNLDNNMQNMEYANVIILGNGTGKNGRFEIDKQITVGDYSRLCMNIDQISQIDLVKLASHININATGMVNYFSSQNNKFILTGSNAINQNKLVKSYDNYANFLSDCGITMKSSQSVSISSPGAGKTMFEFEVNY